jgi:hypothetical protein
MDGTVLKSLGGCGEDGEGGEVGARPVRRRIIMIIERFRAYTVYGRSASASRSESSADVRTTPGLTCEHADE